MSRRAGWAFWVLAIVLPALALGVIAGSMTVSWLYPDHPAETRKPSVSSMSTVLVQEESAAKLIERAANSRYTEALSLAAAGTLTRDLLNERVTVFHPTVISAATLPDGQALVWVEYRRNGKILRAHYLVRMGDDGISGLDGPYAPLGGYAALGMDIYSEDGRLIDRGALRGKGLILVTPRRPDPYLPPVLEELRLEAEKWGVIFVLALDTASPDWLRYARAQGYNGTIWRIKGNLDTIPALAPFPFMGATGLLVDRDGMAVAPLSAIDPPRYGRDPDELTAILALIIKAFRLSH